MRTFDHPDARKPAAGAVRQAAAAAAAWLREHGPLLMSAAVVLALAGLALWLLWLVLAATGTGLGRAGDGLTSAGRDLAHTVAAPLDAWLDVHVHGAGLAASPGQLAGLWAVVAGVVWLQALLGSRFARIAWTLLGAATLAAVYTGSLPAAAPAATAAAAAIWLLISLPAYASAEGGVLTHAMTRYADTLARRAADRREQATGRGQQ